MGTLWQYLFQVVGVGWAEVVALLGVVGGDAVTVIQGSVVDEYDRLH